MRRGDWRSGRFLSKFWQIIRRFISRFVMRDVYPLLCAENGVQGCVTRIRCADCVGSGEDCWFTLKSAGYDTKAMMFDIPFSACLVSGLFCSKTCIPLLLACLLSVLRLYISAFQIGLFYLFPLHWCFVFWPYFTIYPHIYEYPESEKDWRWFEGYKESWVFLPVLDSIGSSLFCCEVYCRLFYLVTKSDARRKTRP